MKFNRAKLFAVLVLMMYSYLGYPQKLTKVWETDSLFNKPESALFDAKNQVIYVSNINGKYRTKDGNGFISKVDLNGNIMDLKWINGLDSPQGMGILGNSLYVADLDRVVEIDIAEAQIKQVFEIDSAQFLNDVSVDALGCVYVSDCVGNKIYKIENNGVGIWLEDTLLKGPNGLLASADEFFILNMGNGIVYQADSETKSLSKFSGGIRNCDGIVSDGKDGFFVTGAWQGEVYHLNSTGDKALILDLGKSKIIAADIEYIIGERMLLVPTLNKTLIAYQWTE